MFNPNPCRKAMDEQIFEKFGFESYVRAPGTTEINPGCRCATLWLVDVVWPAAALAVRGYQQELKNPEFGALCCAALRPWRFLAMVGHACVPLWQALAARSLWTLVSPTSICSPTQLIVYACTGYSFTHFVPVADKVPVYSAVKRLNVGGKLLTNFLKETVSYRCVSRARSHCNSPYG
jgi:hypothetical protein